MSYKTNFLTTVIFRIDFSPILLLQESLKPEYQESLRPQFPILESIDLIQHKVTLIGQERKEDKTLTKQWSLFNKNKTIKITTYFNFLSIECFEYASFKEFQSIVKIVYANFNKFYEPIVCERIGLRYINNIKLTEGNPLIWSDYLSPFLANLIEEFPYRENLARAMSQFIINEDDHKIIINTGISNREFPSRISRKEFTLDFDCSSEDCEGKETLPALSSFYDRIKDLFEKCITDKLRSLMEGSS